MTQWQLTLDKTAVLPLYTQIYRQLRRLILAGVLLAGERLPASRRLAHDCGVARVTVMQAYEQLVAEGYVIGKQGAGMYVAEDISQSQTATIPFVPHFSLWGERILQSGFARRANTARPEIDFGFGRSFPHIFPYDIWRRLLARYLSTDDVMLSRYGSVAGFAPLRAALAHYLQRWRGVHCTAEQVVIVSGAQQALDILARLLLTNGSEVLVESPGYADAFTLFQLYNARLVALPVDDEGFPVEKMPRHCQARLAFVTPSNQFPRGGTLPLGRRLQLLQWAQQQQAVIIEDDYDGDLRYDGRFQSALQGLDCDLHGDAHCRVVYLGSFSKVLFPALRLSYVVLPQQLLTPFLRAKQVVDRGAPTLTQAAVSDFMTEGHFEKHLRQLRRAYGLRRKCLIDALQMHLPTVRYCREAAGLHVMLYLPEEMDEAWVVGQTAVVGVGVYAGAPYHVEDPAPPSILLGFSGLSEAQIEEGVRRLASVIKRGLSNRNGE